MIGIEERDINGIHVMRLHYTADPEKRSPEWRAEATRGMSKRDIEREYEINWHIASGLPVYAEDFVREWHVAKTPLLAYPGKPIYRGWDFGLTPACVWVQMDAMGRLNIIAEHVTWDGRGEMKQQGIESLAPTVVMLSNDWFPNAKFTDWADPAGWTKAQTDEKTCVQIMQQNGIHPRQGPVTFTARRRAMRDVLCKASGGRPSLMVSPDCRMVIEAFEGAYRYEEIGETGRYKDTADKNAWSHPMDALSYVVGGLFTPSGRDEGRRRPPKLGRPDRVTGY